MGIDLVNIADNALQEKGSDVVIKPTFIFFFNLDIDKLFQVSIYFDEVRSCLNVTGMHKRMVILSIIVQGLGKNVNSFCPIEQYPGEILIFKSCVIRKVKPIIF